MKETEETEQSMYTIMRGMDKNTKLIVSIDHWDLVRMYASQLKRDFGVTFSVRRMITGRTKKNFILVERAD